MKAAIYTRVSTPGQAQEGESLEMQKDSLISYAKAQGWEVYKIYEDGGFSGGSSDRPAFQEMLAGAKQRKFDVLLVYKIDRLSRSILDFHTTMKLLQQNNISFVSLTQQFDTSTSMGRLMLAILVDFANFEREINVDRARDSYLNRLKNGVHSGRTPYGYKRENGKLIIDQEKAETVKEVFEKGLKGWSSQKIADEMNLSLDHVKSIITNPFYTGFVSPRRDKYGHRIQKYTEWHKGQHEALISFETYKRILEMRSKPNNGKHPALFSKMLYCPYCKHNLTVKYQKYKHSEYLDYRCLQIKSGDQHCGQSIKESDLEKLLVSKIDKVFKLRIPRQNSKLSIQEKIGRIDKRIEKALDLINIDSISSEDIKKRIEELNKEKESLLNQKQTVDYKKLSEKLAHLKDIYFLATPDEKKELWSILIERIVAYKDHLEVHWKDGSVSDLKRILCRCGGDEGI